MSIKEGDLAGGVKSQRLRVSGPLFCWRERRPLVKWAFPRRVSAPERLKLWPLDRHVAIARRKTGVLPDALWTNDVLVSARRIYQAVGFRLTHEERHRSFGHDLVGQTWEIDLS